MNKLCARLEWIVSNRRQRGRTENYSHCRTCTPQLSGQSESTQSAGTQGNSRLSRILSGFIYYY